MGEKKFLDWIHFKWVGANRKYYFRPNGYTPFQKLVLLSARPFLRHQTTETRIMQHYKGIKCMPM